ncbi:hypothetical protein GF324_07350 [bacterium]|nr:hypothetical protein [bacterium]
MKPVSFQSPSVRRLVSLFLLQMVCLTVLPGCARAETTYHPVVEEWLETMRSDGLALSTAERTAVENAPRAAHPRRDALLERYPDILAAVEAFRNTHKQGFEHLSGSERAERLRIAEDAIRAILTEVLWPLWSGGAWTINGTAQIPQSGSIACGHYVQRLMTASGFQVESRPGLHMAHLASDEQVWSWGGVHRENLGGWDGLERFVAHEGHGVYIVGMSADWGHVMFLHAQRGRPPQLNHAGPSPGGANVTYDRAEPYVKRFLRPYLVHAVKLDSVFARKWLTGKAFYPIKTKTYPGESSPPQRVATIQTRLRDLGYYRLTVDYEYGPGTRSAIGSFQRRNNLPITLLPDDPTLAVLEDALPASDERRGGYGRLIKAEDHVNRQVRDLIRAQGLGYPSARVYLRAFKAERELELWAAEGAAAEYVLVKTYPITAFSGQLGPKYREGDGQIPEGCYHIERYNPASSFHLSLGLDYPNRIDRARAGSRSPGGDIFIHGDRATIGCIPIGDKSIEELYVIAMDARDHGGEPIPVHIFPYRFGSTTLDTNGTPEDIRSLWNDLEVVYRHFERTRILPPVQIRSGRYCVDSRRASGNRTPPRMALPGTGECGGDVYSWAEGTNDSDRLDHRFDPPQGYERVPVSERSYGAWLRGLPLEPGRGVVLYHDGRQKHNQRNHAAVVAVDCGAKDLQQCADAVIRLHAEYLYGTNRRDLIAYHFTSGDLCRWSDWKHGYRPLVQGNDVRFMQRAAPDSSYASFRSYLDTVFMYAGTLSIHREAKPVPAGETAQPGDFLLDPGSPGHAMLVIDAAHRSETGEETILLAQSYMPAQSIHIVNNLTDPALSPWYRWSHEREIQTPDWRFEPGQLYRWTRLR